MTFLHSILLGILEGVTEFLPVSSTGHLILANTVFNIQESTFTKSFDIIIQLGAISAVIALYWKILWRWETIKKLIVAFIPTGVIGLVLYKVAKTYFLGNTTLVVWMLALGGAALIVFERWYAKKNHVIDGEGGEMRTVKDIPYKQAFYIGIFQSVAIVPGVSRSAATIVGGLTLGLPRTLIVEFSFLLAVPTMLAASTLDLFNNYQSFSGDQFGMLTTGFMVAFLVALVSIKFLLRYVRRNTFTSFGIYRIITALLFWLIIL